MELKWSKPLSSIPLCGPGDGCTDNYMVNAAVISDDGRRALAGTYYYPYKCTTRGQKTDGRFGTYAFDTTGTGTALWTDEYLGNQGVFAVAMSGDGLVAASGGLLTGHEASALAQSRGMLRAYDLDSGRVLLNASTIQNRITSLALSHDGGVLAAVSREKLLVYRRQGNGQFDPTPLFAMLDADSESVAMHRGGRWLVAIDKSGAVSLVTIAADRLDVRKWRAKEVKGGGAPTGVFLHYAAIARGADAFAVCGDRFVYLLTPASLAAGHAIGRFASPVRATIRFLALADDASFLTASVTHDSPKECDDPNTVDPGVLVRLSLSPAGDGSLRTDWTLQLPFPPNSTSIDGAGRLATVATGYPNHRPAAFHLVDAATGQELDRFGTVDMNWPMQISRNGARIIAGGDDNTLYCFTP